MRPTNSYRYLSSDAESASDANATLGSQTQGTEVFAVSTLQGLLESLGQPIDTASINPSASSIPLPVGSPIGCTPVSGTSARKLSLCEADSAAEEVRSPKTKTGKPAIKRPIAWSFDQPQNTPAEPEDEINLSEQTRVLANIPDFSVRNESAPVMELPPVREEYTAVTNSAASSKHNSAAHSEHKHESKPESQPEANVEAKANSKVEANVEETKVEAKVESKVDSSEVLKNAPTVEQLLAQTVEGMDVEGFSASDQIAGIERMDVKQTSTASRNSNYSVTFSKILSGEFMNEQSKLYVLAGIMLLLVVSGVIYKTNRNNAVPPLADGPAITQLEADSPADTDPMSTVFAEDSQIGMTPNSSVKNNVSAKLATDIKSIEESGPAAVADNTAIQAGMNNQPGNKPQSLTGQLRQGSSEYVSPEIYSINESDFNADQNTNPSSVAMESTPAGTASSGDEIARQLPPPTVAANGATAVGNTAAAVPEQPAPGYFPSTNVQPEIAGTASAYGRGIERNAYGTEDANAMYSNMMPPPVYRAPDNIAANQTVAGNPIPPLPGDYSNADYNQPNNAYQAGTSYPAAGNTQTASTYPQSSYPQTTYPATSYPAATYPATTYPAATYPQASAPKAEEYSSPTLDDGSYGPMTALNPKNNAIR